MKVFHCMAEIEDYIEELHKNGLLRVGEIGQFSDGKKVLVTGKTKTTGYFGGWAVRWVCPEQGKTGMFSKGMAFYQARKEFPDLPQVK